MLKEIVFFFISMFHAFFLGHAMQDDQTLIHRSAKALALSSEHLHKVPMTIPQDVQQRLIDTVAALRVKHHLYPLKLRPALQSPRYYKGICAIEGISEDHQIIAVDCDGRLVACQDTDLINCTNWNTETDPSSSVWDLQHHHLFIGQRNGRISILDPKKKELVNQIVAHHNVSGLREVTSLALKSNLLLSAGQDALVKVWDTRNYNQKASFSHKEPVKNASFNKVSQIISASRDGLVQFTDLETGQSISTYQVAHGSLSRMKLLQDPHVVLVSFCNQISAYDTRTSRPVFTLSGHTAPITSLAIQNAGYFASGSFDRTVKMWDVRMPSLAADMNHDEWIQSLSSIDNKLISGSRDTTVRVWDTKPLEKLRTISLPDIVQLADIVTHYEANKQGLKEALVQKLTQL